LECFRVGINDAIESDGDFPALTLAGVEVEGVGTGVMVAMIWSGLRTVEVVEGVEVVGDVRDGGHDVRREETEEGDTELISDNVGLCLGGDIKGGDGDKLLT
jgi:hypothetical protein